MPQKSYQVTHTSQACLGEAQNRKWTESGLTHRKPVLSKMDEIQRFSKGSLQSIARILDPGNSREN